MKGIVPAGAGWRGKLWGEIQQGIIVMMMRGWDLRLNTRVRLILAMSAK